MDYLLVWPLQNQFIDWFNQHHKGPIVNFKKVPNQKLGKKEN